MSPALKAAVTFDRRGVEKSYAPFQFVALDLSCCCLLKLCLAQHYIAFFGFSFSHGGDFVSKAPLCFALQEGRDSESASVTF